ncbi:MAG: hypothetical protein JST11_03005 [Acidobacteria bacterium]|nr:hypothetical protein [Acidobacteriota bacterium]
MTRLRFAPALALAALFACARPTPVPDAFPPTLGPWHRTALRDLPPAQPPDAIPARTIEAIRAASYEGPGKLDARLYALPTPAAALDAVQRWSPRPDTVFFYKDRFFVVVQWRDADRRALQAFLGDLQKRFPSK